MDNEFIKYLQENIDKETEIEIRLIDNKHGKTASKMLTYGELVTIVASIDVEWNKKGDK